MHGRPGRLGADAIRDVRTEDPAAGPSDERRRSRTAVAGRSGAQLRRIVGEAEQVGDRAVERGGEFGQPADVDALAVLHRAERSVARGHAQTRRAGRRRRTG